MSNTETAYDMGWHAGYYRRTVGNPFAEGTQEAQEWQDGLECGYDEYVFEKHDCCE